MADEKKLKIIVEFTADGKAAIKENNAVTAALSKTLKGTSAEYAKLGKVGATALRSVTDGMRSYRTQVKGAITDVTRLARVLATIGSPTITIRGSGGGSSGGGGSIRGNRVAPPNLNDPAFFRSTVTNGRLTSRQREVSRSRSVRDTFQYDGEGNAFRRRAVTDNRQAAMRSELSLLNSIFAREKAGASTVQEKVAAYTRLASALDRVARKYSDIRASELTINRAGQLRNTAAGLTSKAATGAAKASNAVGSDANRALELGWQAQFVAFSATQAVMDSFAQATRFAIQGLQRLASVIEIAAESFLKTNEQFAGFELTLKSVFGSDKITSAITDEIATIAGKSFIPTEDILNLYRSASVLPQFKQRFAGEASSGQLGNDNSQFQQFRRLIEEMVAFRPDKSAQDAIFSVREALGGNFVSLARRFDISINTIARQVGLTREQLKKSPELTLKAMKQFFGNLITPETIDALAKQPSRLIGNIQEQFTVIANRTLGTSGTGDVKLYDGILNKFVSLLDNTLAPFFKSGGPFATDYANNLADSIGSTFSKVYDGIGNGIESILTGFGFGRGQTGIVGVMDRLVLFVQELSNQIGIWLPAIINGVAKRLPEILDAAKTLVGAMVKLADIAVGIFDKGGLAGLFGAISVYKSLPVIIASSVGKYLRSNAGVGPFGAPSTGGPGGAPTTRPGLFTGGLAGMRQRSADYLLRKRIQMSSLMSDPSTWIGPSGGLTAAAPDYLGRKGSISKTNKRGNMARDMLRNGDLGPGGTFKGLAGGASLLGEIGGSIVRLIPALALFTAAIYVFEKATTAFSNYMDTLDKNRVKAEDAAGFFKSGASKLNPQSAINQAEIYGKFVRKNGGDAITSNIGSAYADKSAAKQAFLIKEYEGLSEQLKTVDPSKQTAIRERMFSIQDTMTSMGGFVGSQSDLAKKITQAASDVAALDDARRNGARTGIFGLGAPTAFSSVTGREVSATAANQQRAQQNLEALKSIFNAAAPAIDDFTKTTISSDAAAKMGEFFSQYATTFSGLPVVQIDTSATAATFDNFKEFMASFKTLKGTLEGDLAPALESFAKVQEAMDNLEDPAKGIRDSFATLSKYSADTLAQVAKGGDLFTNPETVKNTISKKVEDAKAALSAFDQISAGLSGDAIVNYKGSDRKVSEIRSYLQEQTSSFAQAKALSGDFDAMINEAKSSLDTIGEKYGQIVNQQVYSIYELAKTDKVNARKMSDAFATGLNLDKGKLWGVFEQSIEAHGTKLAKLLNEAGDMGADGAQKKLDATTSQLDKKAGQIQNAFDSLLSKLGLSLDSLTSGLNSAITGVNSWTASIFSKVGLAAPAFSQIPTVKLAAKDGDPGFVGPPSSAASAPKVERTGFTPGAFPNGESGGGGGDKRDIKAEALASLDSLLGNQGLFQSKEMAPLIQKQLKSAFELAIPNLAAEDSSKWTEQLFSSGFDNPEFFQAQIEIYSKIRDAAISSAQGLDPMSESFQKIAEQATNAQQGIMNATDALVQLTQNQGLFKAIGDISEAFKSGLTDGLSDFITGAKTAKEAMADFAKEFINSAVRILVNQAVSSLFGSFAGATSGGGAASGLFGQLFGMLAKGATGGRVSSSGIGDNAVMHFAGGGRTKGGSYKRDDIPAMLMGDEFVINQFASRKLGYAALDYINKTGMLPPQRAEGGYVNPPSMKAPSYAGASSAASIENNITIHIDQKGNASTQSNNNDKMAQNMAKAIKAAVKEEITESMRQGGSLSGSRR